MKFASGVQKHRKGKRLTQVHTAGKWLTQGLDPGSGAQTRIYQTRITFKWALLVMTF